MKFFRKKKSSLYFSYFFLIVVSTFACFPLFWGLMTSLKQDVQIVTFPPTLIPKPLTFKNYYQIFATTNISRYLFNSAFVSLMSVLVCLFIGAHGAYAISRYRFPGRDKIAIGILALSMMPGIALLVPLYVIAHYVGLYNSYTALILVYSAMQMPNVLWLMRAFINRIPRDIEDSALIDGCSPLMSFYKILIPLMRPCLASAGMLVFVNVWNDWLIGNVLAPTENKQIIQMGLFRLIGDTGVKWGPFSAYTMIAILPIVFIFSLLHKSFMSGVVAGSLKE